MDKNTELLRTELPKTDNDLLSYFQAEARQHRDSGLLKSAFSHGLFWIAIIASFLVTLVPLLELAQPKALVPILAAIPGAVLLINNTFKYPSAAKWHRLKQRKLESLYLRLKFGRITISEAMDEFITAQEQLDELRVHLEAPPIK